MSKIENVDKNFKTEKHPVFGDVTFYGADNYPFRIYGLIKENGCYARLPKAIAEKVNPGVLALHKNSAGGRIRFKTNSEFIAIKATFEDIGKMPHFALTGSAGFDMYDYDGQSNEYLGSFVPPYDITDSYESKIDLGNKKTRNILINFPTYSSVKKLEIGLAPDALAEPSPEYISSRPVIFYGSSITQGGCCSRPGMTYEAILSSEFNFDYINLGFSGNAKGETFIAEYIASLDPSVFVMDYDHNAPSTEHLENTHKSFFQTFSNIRPETPVIIMSRPKSNLNDDEKIRLNIIYNTYKYAMENGNRKVYFLGGKELTESVKDQGTVDNCHPTDLGFFDMAKALKKVFSELTLN